MSSEQLREYQRRRDLDSSGEPAGGEPSVGDFPLFVIQRHEATALHFDVRLEIGGVLVSWAVPKGPSTNPSDKRLAVRTEDHPMDYATFEGRIGEGYGAGTVVVWDTGPYVGTTRKAGQDVPLGQALTDGHLTVWLEGHKIRGGYAFTRTGERAGKEQWLLVKKNDEAADRRRKPAQTEPGSVLSGKTNDQL